MGRPMDGESIVIYITAFLNQVGIASGRRPTWGGWDDIGGTGPGRVEEGDHTTGRRDVRIGDSAAGGSAAIDRTLLANLRYGGL